MLNVGKVLDHKKVDGRSDVSIVDEFYMPLCVYLHTFIQRYSIIGTKRTYSYQLLYIYRYFASQSIDLAERVIRGEYLTKGEYIEFKRYCYYKDVHWMKKENNVSSFKRFSDKQLGKMIHVSTASNELVSAHIVKIRLSLFADFFEYMHNMHHFSVRPDSSIQHHFENLLLNVKSELAAIKDQNQKVVDPHESQVPNVIFDRLCECILPHSPNNPFSFIARHRNYLIVQLTIETGLRRGAVAKLKLSDIVSEWHNPRIRVTRTPNDPCDPRINKPSQKTKAHTSPVSQETMKNLLEYIEVIRPIYTKNESHEFVFVTEKGKSKGLPLTITGFDYVFKILSKNLGFHLTSHMLRHKWNERFSENAEKIGIVGDHREDIRKNAMGWNENSSMGMVYNQKNLAIKAQLIQQSIQREQFKVEGDDE